MQRSELTTDSILSTDIPLESGPRNKNIPTQLLEFIISYLLLHPPSAHTKTQKQSVSIEGYNFDLSLLLPYVDFEQLRFYSWELDAYPISRKNKNPDPTHFHHAESRALRKWTKDKYYRQYQQILRFLPDEFYLSYLIDIGIACFALQNEGFCAAKQDEKPRISIRIENFYKEIAHEEKLSDAKQKDELQISTKIENISKDSVHEEKLSDAKQKEELHISNKIENSSKDSVHEEKRSDTEQKEELYVFDKIENLPKDSVNEEKRSDTEQKEELYVFDKIENLSKDSVNEEKRSDTEQKEELHIFDKIENLFKGSVHEEKRSDTEEKEELHIFDKIENLFKGSVHEEKRSDTEEKEELHISTKVENLSKDDVHGKKLPIKKLGFTASSGKSVDKHPFAVRKDIFIMQIKESGINKMGKEINKFSVFPNESEILFPPGTEFIYKDSKESVQSSNKDRMIKINVEARPVRTLNNVRHYKHSFSSQEIINFKVLRKMMAFQHLCVQINKKIKNSYSYYRMLSFYRHLFDDKCVLRKFRITLNNIVQEYHRLPSPLKKVDEIKISENSFLENSQKLIEKAVKEMENIIIFLEKDPARKNKQKNLLHALKKGHHDLHDILSDLNHMLGRHHLDQTAEHEKPPEEIGKMKK